MGRTKGKHIHTLAKEIVKKMPSSFSTSFRTNKDKLKAMKLITNSKKELNKLAGNVTGLMLRIKPKQKPAAPTAAAPAAVPVVTAPAAPV